MKVLSSKNKNCELPKLVGAGQEPSPAPLPFQCDPKTQKAMTVLASPSNERIMIDNSDHGIKERRAIDILAPFTVIHAKLRAIGVRSSNGHHTGII